MDFLDININLKNQNIPIWSEVIYRVEISLELIISSIVPVIVGGKEVNPLCCILTPKEILFQVKL